MRLRGGGETGVGERCEWEMADGAVYPTPRRVPLDTPFREATGGEGYVVFEQSGAPMTIGRGHRQDVEALREEGRRLRDRLAQGRRSWWQRPLGG